MAGCQTLPVSGIDAIPTIVVGVVLVISGLAAVMLARRRGWRRLAISIGGLALVVAMSGMATEMARAADAGTCVGGGVPVPASTVPSALVSPDLPATTTVTAATTSPAAVTTTPVALTTTAVASSTTTPKGPPPVVPEAPAVVLLGVSALSVAGIAGLGMRRRSRRTQA